LHTRINQHGSGTHDTNLQLLTDTTEALLSLTETDTAGQSCAQKENGN
jgi:hypothetical protein